MINLTYTLGENGWAFIDAEFGPKRIRFRVSYMSRALDDLVSSTISSLTGLPLVRFALIDEPGSHCWALVRKAALIHISVFHIDSMFAVEKFNKYGTEADTLPPEMGGHLVASAECPAFDFGLAVARMLKQIEDRYTLDDFNRSRNKPVMPALSLELSKLLERS